MTLEVLGNVGDFLGGIGVLMTLVYLTTQIRNNTRSTRSASYQAAVSSISDLSRAIGLDSNATRVMAAGMRDRAALDPVERSQFDMLLMSLLRNMENIHYQYEAGAITDELWSGWALRILSTTRPRGAQDWWVEQKLAFSPSFREFVDARAGDDGGLLNILAGPPSDEERP